ncbi:MAG: hypothetical protein IRY91_05135 [Gemmatimonadaceae bacterium]|nr:hypothetical protein [Gemmatimonadaceae bacterium]
MLVLLMTVALASLALSSIYLAFNGTVLSRAYEREQDFRYAAEAALAMGKSRLNNDPYALPDTGYVQLIANGAVTGADGKVIPGVEVNVYLGPTGSATGQYGRFASVVADAHDKTGARYVRRLEVTQESFAKFAYWTDKESADGTIIYFNNGDILFGPVWTNDYINIGSGGATFNDEVGTAKTISGKNYGTFKKGYTEHGKPIALPSTTVLSKLAGYAASGNFSFTAPNSSDETRVLMRIEFVPVDLDGDSAATADNEGFFRVYTAKSGNYAWLRGDYQQQNCGDWHRVTTSKGVNEWQFFPAYVHSLSWFPNNGTTFKDKNATLAAIMATTTTSPAGGPLPRCFPGGDPHLTAVEMTNASTKAWIDVSWADAGASPTPYGGTSRTFPPPNKAGYYGSWATWSSVPTPVKNLGRADSAYLFPLYRGFNPGTQGVIYVNGTTALSGAVRGRVTVYATGTVVLPDNLTYETSSDPAAGICPDVLGLIAGKNVVVADNGLLTPQKISGTWKIFGAAPGVTINAVMMTLNTSFTVEDYDSGPTNAVDCGPSNSGRGCLNLVGGVIQEARGPVGTSSGTGYIKRYTYDRCALLNPPPFFPTTGRFVDNRYYEVDPSTFDVAKLYAGLKPKM